VLNLKDLCYFFNKKLLDMENENLKNEEIKKDNKANEHADAAVKPDPETLGKTDPQEEMEGPVSSLMQKGSKVMETKEDKENASKRHNDNM
jgi:hypothetical protein